jgi:putative heme iron utilization protein
MYPSFAEAARTLVAANRHAVLATVNPDGYPYSSIVAYAALENGDMLLLLSQLAEHTKHIADNPQASFFLHDKLGLDDPLAEPRLSLLGKVQPAAEVTFRQRFLELHRAAAIYIDFADFAFYRFTPETLYYIAGFGRMGWADADAYCTAQVDPLLTNQTRVITHMNEDHADALLDYVQAFAGVSAADVDSATMLSLDYLGFEVLVNLTERGQKRVRVPFLEPVTEPENVRQAMIDLSHEASSK